ncbi:hypothetical protein LDENG_00014580 [Lucifuga dentata]|nr:hypothetical protein LDENG_00014580 [Lucifuga dentata]
MAQPVRRTGLINLRRQQAPRSTIITILTGQRGSLTAKSGPAMGRKLDLSGLSTDEAEHVLQVVQRDMRLRKKEEERLSDLKQELDEEGCRCLLLSQHGRFNRHCCIRCCTPFTFLLNPKRQCRDCRYNVCKSCCVYNTRDKAWLCSTCQKSRLLKTQSLEWFYTDVKKRFKRFGSAKVLKTLYKKHLVEHGALSELTEGSAYEDSICNEGSICGSDSSFYRHSEEHSMAEMLSVALRVAEEAIDEAISKAVFDTSSQEKQNEAHYLREHRAELIEELAKTIVQKIINRRKTLAEMKAEYEQDWPLECNTDLYHCQSASSQASGSLKHQPGLWRSRSAFSILDNDPPDVTQDPLQTLKKEGVGSAVSTWRSVDRLDNSMLQSPDGNWIALQNAQLSRPGLLTKRKSQVYSALERESGVVSAYEGMSSDNETRPEPDSSWGVVLQEIHRKMTDSNFSLQDTQDNYSHQDRIPSPQRGCRGSRNDLFSDCEENLKSNKSLLALFKRKVPPELRRPSSSRRTSIIDVNFHVEGAEGENSAAPNMEVGKIRRSRKKRRSKKEPASASVLDYNNSLNTLVNMCNEKKDHQYQPASVPVTPDTLISGSTTPEPLHLESDVSEGGANQIDQEQLTSQFNISHNFSREYELDSNGQTEKIKQGSKESDQEAKKPWEIELDEERTEDEKEEEEKTDEEGLDEEMKCKLYRLIAQSRIAYFSTDDEINRVGQSEEEWEGESEDWREGKTEALPYKLCQLEKEVRAYQFSSTEDELDRVGISDGERKTEEEDVKTEELAVKLCRLADQVNATQFSSTEDELDRAGRGEETEEDDGRAEVGEEAIDEETLWKMQAEKAVQAAQVRDLASLVSACQFSSTEDELDRVGENEGEQELEGNEGGMESTAKREEMWFIQIGKHEEEDVIKNQERRGSIDDFDVKMFDLRDECEEAEKVGDAGKEAKDTMSEEVSDEKGRAVTAENLMKSQMKVENVQQDKREAEEPEESVYMAGKEENEEEREEFLRQTEALSETLIEREKETKERQELERMEDRIEEKGEQGVNQSEVKWSDRMEGEERQKEENIKESKEKWWKWETAAGGDEEDLEFDRIISSMLMMCVHEKQVDTAVKDESEKNRGREREPEKVEEGENDKIETGVKEKVLDLQSTNASEIAEEFGSQGNHLISKSFLKEENGIEPNGLNFSRKQEIEVATIRNRQQERGMEPQERRDLGYEETLDLAFKEETDEAKQIFKLMEMEDEQQEERRRKIEEQQMVESWGGTAGESVEEDDKRKVMDEALQETKQRDADDVEQNICCIQEGLLSPEEIQNRYSAASLRSITTEVLKVLNATEELLQGLEGGHGMSMLSLPSLPSNMDPKKLDQQFSSLEENVYVAAGAVFGLEAELGDLEECARSISGATSDMELSFLEEQVASAAAKVQQSELQIFNISARIAALKSAGLNVDLQSRFPKVKTIPVMPITLDTIRQVRRRLPAPPVKEEA